MNPATNCSDAIDQVFPFLSRQLELGLKLFHQLGSNVSKLTGQVVSDITIQRFGQATHHLFQCEPTETLDLGNMIGRLVVIFVHLGSQSTKQINNPTRSIGKVSNLQAYGNSKNGVIASQVLLRLHAKEGGTVQEGSHLVVG